MNKSNILIYGAGAIGRGFVPWCFQEANLYFVDSKVKLVSSMKKARRYTTYKNDDGTLKGIEVAIADVSTSAKAFENIIFDVIFVCVGPRSCSEVIEELSNFNCAIVLLENDFNLVQKMRKKYDLGNIYFAIPDVITSNTAPKSLLALDELTLVTEKGILYLDENAKLEIPGEYVTCNSQILAMQWDAKLHIHNTAHCIAAYLGALCDYHYLHQAMCNKKIKQIVEGAIEEMLQTLLASKNYSQEFLAAYAEKELSRFQSHLLHDPISRVAREPLRKLSLDGRLIGAANYCLANGIKPKNILKGVLAALLYDNKSDPDKHLSDIYHLSEKLPQAANHLSLFLLNVDPGSALGRLFVKSYEAHRKELADLTIRHQSQDLMETVFMGEMNLEGYSAVFSAAEEIDWSNLQTKRVVRKSEAYRDIVTDIDLKINNAIYYRLEKTGVPILSEESLATFHDFKKLGRVWVLDPIDGTVNLSHGMPEYCISLGLFEKDKFSFGCLYAPALKKYYLAMNGRAYVNRDILETSCTTAIAEALIVVNMNNTPEESAIELYGRLNKISHGCLRMGSAALSLAYLANGSVDIVLGKNKLWDVCAGIALAKNSGAAVHYSLNYDTFDITYVAAATPELLSKVQPLLHEYDYKFTATEQSSLVAPA